MTFCLILERLCIQLYRVSPDIYQGLMKVNDDEIILRPGCISCTKQGTFIPLYSNIVFYTTSVKKAYSSKYQVLCMRQHKLNM